MAEVLDPTDGSESLAIQPDARLLRAQDGGYPSGRRARRGDEVADRGVDDGAIEPGGEEIGVADEARDKGIDRVGVELARRVDLQHHPGAHDRDSVREAQRLFLVVGHEDRRGPGTIEDRLHLTAHANPQRRVEVRERFVEQDDGRLRGERPAQRDPLLLSPGQFVRMPVGLVDQADQLEHLGDASATARPIAGNAVAQVSRHGEVRKQGEILEDDTDTAALGRYEPALTGHRRTVEHHRAAIGALEAGQETQRRRLAAAARPQQGEELSGVDLQIDGIEREDRSKALGQISCGDDGRMPIGRVAPIVGVLPHKGQAILTSVAEMHDTTEEYLETILEIEEEGIQPLRARLVERLGISAPAVSETVARLSAAGYTELLEDRSIRLTPKGRKLATTIVRRHRLAERLLADVIGLEWEKIHREADRWEHAISADVEEKLVELLGDPMTCPHGNPIPGTKRTATTVPTVRLVDADPGQVTVTRISEKLELDDSGLELVARARLIPGATATIVEHDAAGVLVRTPAGEHTVPAVVAEQMFVATGTR